LKPFSISSSQKLDFRWIILLIVILLLIILAWPDPASGAYHVTAGDQVETATATVRPLPTFTPIPLEYLENTDQTSGIICGSVILVMIIVGGTLGVLRRKNGKSDHK
jgi:hypothetical protein